MEIQEWLAVINPHAGNNKCKRDWHLISRLLSKKNIKFNAEFTKGEGDAIRITKRFIKKGYRNFIIIGGDGTLNEVVNGIFTQKEVKTDKFTLAAIPVGTGNDWRRTFNISNGYSEAIELISKRNTFIQDIGKITYHNEKQKKHTRYFINAAGLGYDAIVCNRVNELKKKNRGGRLAYYFSLLASLYSFDHAKTDIQIDNEKFHFKTFSITIGICKYNGGGMMTVPHAIPDNGKLSVSLIRKMSKFAIIRNISGLKDGSYIKHRKVKTYDCDTIKIESATKLMLEADGESLGETPCFFSLIPKSISVIINTEPLPIKG